MISLPHPVALYLAYIPEPLGFCDEQNTPDLPPEMVVLGVVLEIAAT